MYLTKAGKRGHVRVAEGALGGPLPKKAAVHHVDEDKHNNENNNLVICQDQAYHALLHQRTVALKTTGNPSSVRCRIRSKHDEPSAMAFRAALNGYLHKECAANKERMRRKRLGSQHREQYNAYLREWRKRRKAA